MTQISIEVEKKSLRWWSIQTDIPFETLKKWCKGFGAKAPYSSEKMIDILSYGTGKSEKAPPITRAQASKNLSKAEDAIKWL